VFVTRTKCCPDYKHVVLRLFSCYTIMRLSTAVQTQSQMVGAAGACCWIWTHWTACDVLIMSASRYKSSALNVDDLPPYNHCRPSTCLLRKAVTRNLLGGGVFSFVHFVIFPLSLPFFLSHLFPCTSKWPPQIHAAKGFGGALLVPNTTFAATPDTFPQLYKYSRNSFEAEPVPQTHFRCI